MKSLNSKFTFGTKAETLKALSQLSNNFIVLPLMFFTYDEWVKNPDDLLDRIQNKFQSPQLVVRSSAIGEDSITSSHAGEFKSVLNVETKNHKNLKNAIEQVFSSYTPHMNKNNQVLIQEMIDDSILCGVIMTRMIDDGAPYYVFNYDDESNATDTITGGKGVHKTVLVHREAKAGNCDSKRLRSMLQLARDLESLCDSDTLDIEFAINKFGEVILLQVRKITSTNHWEIADKLSNSTQMHEAKAIVQNLMNRKSSLFGNKTILGNMPDWNPAEIIGVHPSPLASSLYKHLITSHVWHEARTMMGYREMPNTDLMIMISGSPYIDVRASFNSFLPQGLDPRISETLVNSWINRLEKHPELHDKIEFEVVPTVYDLDFPNQFQNKYRNILSISQFEEYKESLSNLTQRNISLAPDSSLKTALRQIDILTKKHKKNTFKMPYGSNSPIIQKWISDSLSDCIKFGTLPFSIIARHGFIAESLLRSLVRLKAISPERLQQFKLSFPTVLGELSRDHKLVQNRLLSKESFLERYGHLRPGTYDITATTYTERSEFLENASTLQIENQYHDFILSDQERQKVNQHFQRAGFSEIDSDLFFEYCKTSIASREYSKFVFTKSLSHILDAIIEWGKHYNLGREQLSHLGIDEFLKIGSKSPSNNQIERIVQKIESSKAKMKSNRQLKMSYLIRDVKDFNIVPMHRSSPNYITDKLVEGKVTCLSSLSNSGKSLKGRIICIENADPGFDWIFSENILGLVTKYGGANSHMAIRCAEINLPAAIGCGDMIYSSLQENKIITLSCKDKAIRY